MQVKQSKLAAFIELSKIRITISVTLSTLAGYILYSHTIDTTAFWVSMGVFLLASSSAALNQYQERKTDALMSRTQHRPMPSGKLKSQEAFLLVALLFIAGSAILYFKTSLISLGLGLLSFLWYNGIYTPLKYRTVFALIIGSVIGALPPIIGWTAAGGDILDPSILSLAFFIYVWQVPHFILLLLLYGDDYKTAGLPVLTTYYGERRVRRIIFTWIIGTVVTTYMLPLSGELNYWLSSVLIFTLSLGLGISMISLLDFNRPFKVKRAFILMNIYLLAILLVISVDQLSIV